MRPRDVANRAGSGTGWLLVLIAYISLLPYYDLPSLPLPGLAHGLPLFKYAPCGWILAWTVAWVQDPACRAALWQVPLRWPLLAWVLAGVLSSVCSQAPLVSMSRLGYYMVTGPLLYSLVVARDWPQVVVETILRRILMIGTIAVGVSFVIFLLPGELGARTGASLYNLHVDTWFPDFLRAGRLVTWPNGPWELGAYALLLLILSYGSTLRVGWRGVGWTQSWFFFLALWLTFAGGAYLGGIVGLSVLWWLGRRWSNRSAQLQLAVMVGLLILTAAAIAAGWMVGPSQVDRLTGGWIRFEIFAQFDQLWHRVRVTDWALRQFATSPFTGIGLVQSPAFEAQHQNLHTDTSGYVVLLMSTGVLGFGVFLTGAWTFGALLVRSLRMARRDATNGFSILAVAILALSLDALYWNSGSYPTIRMMTWLVTGLVVTLIRRAWQIPAESG